MEIAELFLLMFYIIIVIFQIALLIIFIKNNKEKHWIILIITEIISMLLSWFLAIFFDSLPGSGIFPGLTHFAEVFYSIIAVLVFFIMLIITLFIKPILNLINHKKKKKFTEK